MNETKITELHTRLCETSRECVAKVTTGFSPRYFRHNNNFTRLRTHDWIIMDNWRFAQVIMRPSYEEQLAFWE